MKRFLVLCAFVAATSHAAFAQTQVDILIAGGTVVDGSGGKERKADVGVRGDRIVFIGDAGKSRVTASRTIDAKGLVVTPGYIDPHTHSGDYLSREDGKSNVNYLMQGVTTVVTGNDGGGTVRTGELLARWDKQGLGSNAALLVGHGAVRREVLGNADVQPTAGQLEKMKALVREAMNEGAFGLSSGLFYVPGKFSKTEEVIALAAVAGEMGGIYDTHQRDESDYSLGVIASIEECIRIAREGHLPLNISHIKMLGPGVWGKSDEAIRIIQKARKEGVKITADQYPYTASGSGLTASLLPGWAQEGRRDEQLARLRDPGIRAKLAEEMEGNLKRRGGADSLLLTSSNSPYVGKTLAAVAKEKNKPAIDTAIELIIDSMEGRGGVSVASFNMNDKDIERLMKEDFVMTGSDGSGGHPRLYGTYPRKLRLYVYDKKVITLPRFVQASSAQVAEQFHIAERGQLKEGWFADINVFDPATVTDRSTYEKPQELAAGVKYLLVNGKLAVDDGKYTGALAGKALRRK